MNKAELWLVERMTVRRWLVVMLSVGILAAGVGYWALAALRSDDTDGGAVPVGLSASGTEQRPTSMYIDVNVGSVGILDGRAGVTLAVYPTRLPIEWTVTIRTAPTNGASIREVDLKGQEVRDFAKAIDDAVRQHDAGHQATVASTTIDTVEVSPGDFRYDLKCVGTLRLDADGMVDLKRMLDKAEAQRAWLLPRTVALRQSGSASLSVADAVPPGGAGTHPGK